MLQALHISKNVLESSFSLPRFRLLPRQTELSKPNVKYSLSLSHKCRVGIQVALLCACFLGKVKNLKSLWLRIKYDFTLTLVSCSICILLYMTLPHGFLPSAYTILLSYTFRDGQVFPLNSCEFLYTVSPLVMNGGSVEGTSERKHCVCVCACMCVKQLSDITIQHMEIQKHETQKYHEAPK